MICPQVVGEEWRGPLVHGLLHLLGYDHGAEMEAREAAHAVRARRPPSILESFNFAFEGIIHVLRTQRNMRIHFLIAALVLVAALVSRRRQDGADRAPARDRVRPDRGDAEHGGRGRGRRRDDVVRPDGEAREGHRRRRRSDRDRRRRCGRLPRVLRPGRRPELEAARPAHERAGRADADRARADLDPRDRRRRRSPVAARHCAAASRPATPQSPFRAGWRPR